MFHLFSHLVMSANHEDGRWQGVEVKRGQLITGLFALNRDTGISVQTIRTILDRLEQTGEITRKSTNKFSIITINKYSEFQQAEQPAQQASNKQVTSNQQATNNKQECKNEKKNKKDNEGEGSGRKVFVPPTLDEVAEYCLLRGNDLSPQYFIDKYDGNGWMVGKNKMKDWKAVVRTWEKNGFESGRKTSAKTKPMTQKERDAMELMGYGTKTGDSKSSDNGMEFDVSWTEVNR